MNKYLFLLFLTCIGCGSTPQLNAQLFIGESVGVSFLSDAPLELIDAGSAWYFPGTHHKKRGRL